MVLFFLEQNTYTQAGKRFAHFGIAVVFSNIQQAVVYVKCNKCAGFIGNFKFGAGICG